MKRTKTVKGMDNAIFAVAAVFAFAVFGTFASDVRAVGFGGKSGVPESGLPILGWWIIPERFVSRERFREAREAGFTHMMQDAKTVGQMRSYLDMAHAEGIMLSARLPQLHTEPENTVRALMNHPALSTWHIEDEPSAHKFAKLGGIVRRIQAVDSGHPCYVNLLADSSDPIRWLGVADYRVYLGRALKEMSLPLISADFYPCILENNNMPQPFVDKDGKTVLKKHWFGQLEILSSAARNSGLPLSLFACNVAHLNGKYLYPVPTVAHLRLQQYVNLAYGAESLQYFTYWTPGNVKPHYFHESLIRQNGTRSGVYDIVRAVNRELHARAPSFRGGKVAEVCHTGAEIPSGTKRLAVLPAWVEKLDTPGGGAAVSRMERGDEEILMVVNRSPVVEMMLEVSFRDKGVLRILDDGVAVCADRYGPVYRLAPGYAEIFKIGKAKSAGCGTRAGEVAK